MEQKNETNVTYLLLGILTIMFTGFKLAGIISWSWWWVLSPMWFIFGVALLLVLAGAVAAKVFLK